MRRSLPTILLVVPFLPLLALVCDWSQSPVARQETWTRMPSVATGSFLPPEQDGPVHPLKEPREWHASGEDRAGGLWEGYLVVEYAPEAKLCAGYFEWSAQGGGGRYHFRGTYDPATRLVSWSGYSIENRFGAPGMAHYEATLSPDGGRLLNGKWSGGWSIPGSWTAEYVGGPEGDVR